MYYYILRFFTSPALIIVGSSLEAGFSKSDRKVSRRIWNSPAPVPLIRIDAAVDAYPQYPTLRATLGVGTQQGDKPHELSVGNDLECAIVIDITK
jgi:hypothetical protein